MPRASGSLLAVLLLAGCSSAPRPLTTEDYRQRLPALEARAVDRPNDIATLRDLGEALALTQKYGRAREILDRAIRLGADDPATLYYLGVAEEGAGDWTAALAVYARHVDLPRSSPYRRLLSRRHARLLRLAIREELATLVAAEDSLTAEGVTEAVAVFPLRYQSGDSLYAPLGRGLSEMLTVDLASVGRIRVVERIRLQALLDELALSQGAAFDAATAPRLGRLLRSGRVVGGAFAVDSDALRTDVALWAWPTEPLPGLRTRQSALADLFRLQKEIAFGVIADLGIELTPAERERIERIPTRNLEAFLAYSRGLLEEDAGRYAAAAAHYAEAARLDPTFAEADEQAESMSDLATTGGPSMALIATLEVRFLGAPSAGSGRVSLVDVRLGAITSALGATVMPGEGARDATAELPISPSVLPDGPVLPEPPAAPRGSR